MRNVLHAHVRDKMSNGGLVAQMKQTITLPIIVLTRTVVAGYRLRVIIFVDIMWNYTRLRF